jgi:transposase InsO family protein
MHFSTVADATGIKEFKTPYRTPQANGICERFIGSLRRECLDHILIHDDKHLERVVKEYTIYFNQERPLRTLVSAFPPSMSCQSQSQQADASNRRQYLAGCTTVIPVRYI